MRQPIACALVGAGMSLICTLVALLLSDALAPGRFPPVLGFYGACAAGALLIGGLVLLDRRGAVSAGAAPQERRAGGAMALAHRSAG